MLYRDEVVKISRVCPCGSRAPLHQVMEESRQCVALNQIKTEQWQCGYNPRKSNSETPPCTNMCGITPHFNHNWCNAPTFHLSSE